MKQRELRKFKWFWAWQDDKEEAWLRQMAQEGWHLISMFPTTYTFSSGEPHDDVYRLDYFNLKTEEFEEYVQIFNDGGWEYVCSGSGWHYFRRPLESGVSLEIYTDAESKVQKYQRLLGYLVLFLPIWVIIFSRGILGAYPPLGAVITVFSAVIMVLWAYAFLKIALRVRELRRL
ncbi:MAG: DUF2812 domain-containing protein [Anaerolineales bacterium]|nr:DUF2812 domain-containing protein [Anaerolineales bacterium]